jgi:uncharacterized Zn-finger protein
MSNPYSSDQQGQTLNDRRSYEITRRDLPLHWLLQGQSLWNSHPRVYIPIEEAKDGRMICPYCSTEFVLRTD